MVNLYNEAVLEFLVGIEVAEALAAVSQVAVQAVDVEGGELIAYQDVGVVLHDADAETAVESRPVAMVAADGFVFSHMANITLERDNVDCG